METSEAEWPAPPPPPPSPPPPQGDFGFAPAPPSKRQRTDGDQLAAALTKIKTHIGNPKKFAKAAPLLVQMFDEGKLSGAHGDLVFECLKAALRNPEQCRQVQLRKEYVKLFSVASNNAQIFSAQEKEQLDVYGLLAVVRNQLLTDDSFVLNRILSRIKTSIEHLPEAFEEDDRVYRDLQARFGLGSGGRAGSPQEKSVAAVSAELREDGASESGEEVAIPTQPAEQAGAGQTEETWSEEEAVAMKREALLACLEAAREMHSKLWARTSVELAFTEAHSRKEKFAASQHSRLDALQRFAKEQKLARQQGRTAAKDDRRDRTAFETARREWSKTSGISGRGAVGSGGDHRSEVWLG